MDSLTDKLKPILILKDTVGKIMDMVNSMSSKIDALSTMTETVNDLQKDFVLFSSMMTASSETDMEADQMQAKHVTKSFAPLKSP